MRCNLNSQRDQRPAPFGLVHAKAKPWHDDRVGGPWTLTSSKGDATLTRSVRQLFQPRYRDPLQLFRLELGEAAGIGAAGRLRHVLAQEGGECVERGIAHRLARVETVGDVDV